MNHCKIPNCKRVILCETTLHCIHDAIQCAKHRREIGLSGVDTLINNLKQYFDKYPEMALEV